MEGMTSGPGRKERVATAIIRHLVFVGEELLHTLTSSL